MVKKAPAPRSPDLNDTHALRTSFQASLDQAEWLWLAKHVERDAVILVAPGTDLLDIGVRIAQDDAATIETWIQEGKLAKPTRVQLDAWSSEPTKRFLSLVVQPYVLIQEILH